MLESFLDFISQLFQQPALFLGLIALIGLLLTRESIEKIVSGTMKTAIGLLILLAGTTLMSNALGPLGQLATSALGLPKFSVELGTQSIITQFGVEIGLVMLFSFLINLLLARITPMKYIYLTGHLMFWNAVVFLASFRFILGLEGAALVAATSIFVGLYQTVQPWLTHRYDLYVNENSGFVLGHNSSIPVLMTSFITKRMKKHRSMEELSFPKALGWLREPMLLIAVTFVMIYAIVGAFNVSEVSAMSQGVNPAIFIILQALNFAAGFAVLMMGVRMVISELIPAFKGISEKVVPGALPALDCPLFFPYGQVSMAYGGLIGMLSMVVVSICFAGFRYPYFIFAPTMSAWFHGAVAGVYGNKYAGIPGVIIGGIIPGVLMGIGQALMWPVLGFAIGDFFTWAGDTDYVLLPLIIALIGRALD